MNNKENINWCCSHFRESVESKGFRGSAIIAGKDEDFGLYFLFEFRAIALKDESKFNNTSDIPFSLSMTQAIHFCPWCGQSLRDFYANCSGNLISRGRHLRLRLLDERRGA